MTLFYKIKIPATLQYLEMYIQALNVKNSQGWIVIEKGQLGCL